MAVNVETKPDGERGGGRAARVRDRSGTRDLPSSLNHRRTHGGNGRQRTYLNPSAPRPICETQTEKGNREYFQNLFILEFVFYYPSVSRMVQACKKTPSSHSGAYTPPAQYVIQPRPPAHKQIAEPLFRAIFRPISDLKISISESYEKLTFQELFPLSQQNTLV